MGSDKTDWTHLTSFMRYHAKRLFNHFSEGAPGFKRQESVIHTKIFMKNEKFKYLFITFFVTVSNLEIVDTVILFVTKPVAQMRTLKKEKI